MTPTPPAPPSHRWMLPSWHPTWRSWISPTAARCCFFGSKAQEQLTSVSDSMLERVRSKDVGPAGDALNEMVLTLRGFDPREGAGRSGWLSKLMGKGRDAAALLQRYDEVAAQIDHITDDLERHKTELMVDIESLDRLYAANLDYFHTLERYIAAGETGLEQLDAERIPALASAGRGRPARPSPPRSCATCGPCATTWSAGCTTCA